MNSSITPNVKRKSNVTLDSKKVAASYNGRREPHTGVTMVIGYGAAKAEGLRLYAQAVLDELKESLSRWICCGWVELCTIEVIHWTLIGLEGQVQARSHDRTIAPLPPKDRDYERTYTGKERRRDRVVVNESLIERLRTILRPTDVPTMDLAGVVRFYKHLPPRITVQFGGFDQDELNLFDDESKPRRPYNRSFSIQENGLIVGIGWPCENGMIQPTLVGIRHAFERFNVVHKYTVRGQETDDDLFAVFGEVTDIPWKEFDEADYNQFLEDLSNTQDKMREFLAHNRQIVDVGRSDRRIVKYSYTSLREVATQLTVDQATEERLANLYETG